MDSDSESVHSRKSSSPRGATEFLSSEDTTSVTYDTLRSLHGMSLSIGQDPTLTRSKSIQAGVTGSPLFSRSRMSSVSPTMTEAFKKIQGTVYPEENSLSSSYER